MKRTIIMLSLMMLSVSMMGQQAKKDFKLDRRLSASNYLAYPGPLQKQLTPAPTGYHAFYLSHYGRHGSRYQIGKGDYDKPYFILLKADSLNKLTPKGKELLEKVRRIRESAMGRDGELTLRGAEQHKQIAKRMYENFPEIFSDSAHVDAKSTVVIRCILSMENALQQLLIENPKLKIRHDASYHDMYYMNLSDDDNIGGWKKKGTHCKEYTDFIKSHTNYSNAMKLIFNDEDYWKKQIDANWLGRKLFSMASNMQSLDLRNSISLYDIFSDEEIYNSWKCDNAFWYVAFGPSPLSGGQQPYSQRNLLRKIITEADSCIALEHPGATLRYGHDTMVMPLTCLLDLDGLGKQIKNLDDLDKEGWLDYRIFPMACNIQFVFYRKNYGDKDIIFKVLRNENEATLPIKTDIAPYYHWNDFKEYYLKKLDGYLK